MEKSTFSAHYSAVKRAVRELREAAGLTQREAAERLGRERSFISRIEQGERRLDVIEIFWICRAYGADSRKVFIDLLAEFNREERRKKRSR